MSISTGSNPFAAPKRKHPVRGLSPEEQEAIRAAQETSRNPTGRSSQSIRVRPDSDVTSHQREAASSSDSGQESRKRKGQE